MRCNHAMIVAVLLGLGGASFGFAGTVTQPQTTATMTRLNINMATVKDLTGVPGLNVAKARAVVAYRKHNGPFTSLDALQKVPGFKRMENKKMEEIKQHFSMG